MKAHSHVRALLLCLAVLPVLAGCTNVTGGVTRVVNAVSSASLDSAALFSSARDFFTEAGYQCSANSDTEDFRCRKDLRDIYIHQTHAVVKIFPGNEKEGPLLVSNRWDEGLIPGEFISNTFSNPDVAAFCDYLAEAQLAVCREAG